MASRRNRSRPLRNVLPVHDTQRGRTRRISGRACAGLWSAPSTDPSTLDCASMRACRPCMSGTWPRPLLLPLRDRSAFLRDRATPHGSLRSPLSHMGGSHRIGNLNQVLILATEFYSSGGKKQKKRVASRWSLVASNGA